MKITKDYFKWQASVLDAKYKGSIVQNHHGDTGANREVIVRNWLAEHLPKAVTPEIGGKILDQTGYASKQVDITVYDNDMPRFGAYDKPYYFAEGCVGAIQVKSKLTSSELSSSLKNLDSVKKVKVSSQAGGVSFGSREDIPTGIFAFETGYSSISELIEALKKSEKKGISPVDFVYINEKAYIVYNRGTWSKKLDDGTKKPSPKGYILTDKSESCIWRMVVGLSQQATTLLSKNYDFQPYFFSEKRPKKIIPSGSSKGSLS